MFHKNIKLALAFLTIVWSVFEFWQGHIGNGIAILLHRICTHYWNISMV